MTETAGRTLYPLRFEPIFRRYIWGGRRLGTELGKPISEGDDYAESWEIVDHGDDQSRVAAGNLAGAGLRELVEEHADELFGRHTPQQVFPLLVKFLDCNRNLSLQVHPDDERAARLDPPDLGKTEAWIVMDAAPGAVVYAGLKSGTTPEEFAEACHQGTCQPLLHQFEPRPGDCIFIPAGTVHALGEGLLVAEIQQASDTTYRLFDWNRLGADGQPRPLHLERGLEAVDYQGTELAAQQPQATDRPHVARLVECDKFVIDRWQFQGERPIGGDGRFHVVVVLQGEMQVQNDPAEAPLRKGESMLLPASCGETMLATADDVVFLDSYLP